MDDGKALLERLSPLMLEQAAQLDYHGISSRGILRWIVPNERQRLLRVVSAWRPYGLKSRLAWRALTTALVTVGPKFLGLQQLHAVQVGRPDRSFSEWAEGRSLTPVVYVGTPGPYRKLVCQLVDESGAPVAVARIPIGPAAAESIRSDAEALRQLAQSPIAPFIPRLLLGEADPYGLQSVLPGRPATRRFGAEHVDLLLKLPVTAWVSLRQHVQSTLTEFSPILPEDISHHLLDQIPEALVVPRIWQHGDFAPWNMRMHRGDLHVFDWEEATADGLPGWDIAHFHFQQAFLFGERHDVLSQVVNSEHVQRYFAALDVDAQTSRLLVQAYCLQSAFALLKAGKREHADYLLGWISAS